MTTTRRIREHHRQAMAEISRPLPTPGSGDSARTTDVPPRAAGSYRGVLAAAGARGLSAERLAFLGVAGLAGVLYLVDLTISGWANTYYALAAQAASQSWTALFFGSLDASNFITLDKPPLAILPMAIAVKLLGLSSFSLLVPEALLGVGTVVVLFLTVRRAFGTPAAVVAGIVAALTPVAVVIFRYDNPDALLTFLLTTAAYALTRGLEAGRLRWALLAAVLVGLGFLTKYLQAYLVLPAFALTWLLCAPGSVRRRLGVLVASLATVLVASGWWVAIVELVPAADRPFIGGTRSNSVLDLIFGYDGLGRIFAGGADESPLSSALDGAISSAASNGRGGPSFSGNPGPLRLFNAEMGGQIAWLLPAAILAVGSGVARHGRGPRTDRRLAGYVLWGGWLATHILVFSFMSGIVHSYYTVAMAPAIAALVGAGASDLWSHREGSALARLTLAIGVATTGVLAWILLERTPAFLPGLGLGVLAVALAVSIVIALPAAQLDRRIPLAAASLALVAALVGPAAYAAATISRAHSGGDVAAGPAGDGLAGNGGPTVDQRLVAFLVANKGSSQWIVAVNGAAAAADIQLPAQQPVMTMGGFTGGDPRPTLRELQAYVDTGAVRYILLGGGPSGPGPGSDGQAADGGPGPAIGGGVFGGPSGPTAVPIAVWVRTACAPVAVDGTSVAGLYDCADAA